MTKVLLLNGPNLDLLGVREPEIYGHETLSDVESAFRAAARDKGIEVECFQSNHEGALIDRLHEARTTVDGIVYNPAGHTHYSIALRDAIAAIGLPVIEVHISDIDAREDFRHASVMTEVCAGIVKGEGTAGYITALDLLCDCLEGRA